jgi:hypothetical protein
MTSTALSAGELRFHLQELSVSVARQLVAVLDAGRDAPEGLAAELDAAVSEITEIQRDLAYEMAGPPFSGSRLPSLRRMLELQHRTMRLCHRLENLPTRSLRANRGQQARGPVKDQSGWDTAAKSRPRTPYDEELLAALEWSSPQRGSGHSHEGGQQPDPPCAYGDVAVPLPFRPHGAPRTSRWPHLSPTARLSLLPIVLCAVSALVTTAATHFLSDNRTGMWRLAEGAPGRSDKLDYQVASEDEARPRASDRMETGALRDRNELRRAPEPDTQSSVITVVSPEPAPEREVAALDVESPSVPVLATDSDPSVARQTFLALKQRYPAILGNAEAEIESLQTQDGKTWHRLAIVPPVARTEAKELCKQLLAAGHAGCWVKPFRKSSE